MLRRMRWCRALLVGLLLAAGCSSEPAGWTVTVYYTAVETYYDGAPVAVTGCPELDCAHGHADLGAHPKDFVTAVRDEGTGRLTGGGYLNWSHDVGYWLDAAPRDAAGHPLRPYSSAAADPDVLARGTAFTITDCGTEPEDVDDAVCARLRAANWRIVDEFTPGLGGERHVDVYLGEQDRADFTESPAYVTLTSATLAVR
jgi:hypothetical protein